MSIRTIGRFKSCFENLFFLQISTSGIGICCSVYILAFVKIIFIIFFNQITNNCSYHFQSTRINPSQLGAAVATLIYNVFDVFVVMHYGNKIKISSDRLTYCLFESNWVEQSPSYKKCIIMFLEVLKKPHELLIGKLYPLNLQTFTSVS